VAITSDVNRGTIWDIADPTNPFPVASVSGSSFRAGFLLFSPDGRTLATGGLWQAGPGNVTLWDLAELNDLRADPAKYACAITGRGLTADEWKRYVPELPYLNTCPG
jgi:WD40 repeat protein